MDQPPSLHSGGPSHLHRASPPAAAAVASLPMAPSDRDSSSTSTPLSPSRQAQAMPLSPRRPTALHLSAGLRDMSIDVKAKPTNASYRLEEYPYASNAPTSPGDATACSPTSEVSPAFPGGQFWPVSERFSTPEIYSSMETLNHDAPVSPFQVRPGFDGSCSQTMSPFSGYRSTPAQPTTRLLVLDDFPNELLADIFLILPQPAAFLLVSKRIRSVIMGDPSILARWLILHNHLRPSAAPVGDDLRPPDVIHPLLACLKHKTRHQALRLVPTVAEELLTLDPLTSRYDLQRMYRRAIALEGSLCAASKAGANSLAHVASAISNRAVQLYGVPVGNTVSGTKLTAGISIVDAPTVATVGLEDAVDFAAAAEPEATTNALLQDGERGVDTDAPDVPIAFHNGIQQRMSDAPVDGNPITSAEHELKDFSPVLDDRRLLLDAAVGGDVATVGILVDACALCLDGRVVSDAFSRAWDRGDPARLCSVDGWLWPRCQTSRWYVLEKLAKIEEATLMAAAANGLWIDEVSEIVEAVGNSMTLILADAVSADVDMEEHGMRLRVGPISSLLMGTSGSDPNNRTELGQSGFSNQMASTLFGMKPLYPTLWRPKRSFLDRTIDSFVAVSSAKSVDLVLSYRPEVHPRHLSAAIDRGNLTILNLLVEHGANPSWPEDTTLAHLVTRPPSDGVASLFWRHALTIGVVITPRRWEKIAKLGPRTVAAVLETSRALSPAYSISEAADQTGFEPTSRHREVRTTTGGGRSQSMMTKSVAIDPCRDGMAGFRVGGSEVIRCLADAMDATFPCGDALAAAALGDPRALDYCVRVGDVLADMLREGRKEHCCDLLDAGAIVLEDVLALAAAIADAPPGGWEEWPIAARCFRRILVQRRLRLPIPNAHALNELPRTVVTTAFLASLYATRPLLSDRQATVYSQYQRRRHPNTAGIRINLVPVLEYDVSFNVIQSAMEALRELLALYDDPVYPGEAYCFIKGMLQYGLRDKNLLREEDEFILPDDEWEEVALALTTPN